MSSHSADSYCLASTALLIFGVSSLCAGLFVQVTTTYTLLEWLEQDLVPIRTHSNGPSAR